MILQLVNNFFAERKKYISIIIVLVSLRIKNIFYHLTKYVLNCIIIYQVLLISIESLLRICFYGYSFA